MEILSRLGAKGRCGVTAIHQHRIAAAMVVGIRGGRSVASGRIMRAGPSPTAAMNHGPCKEGVSPVGARERYGVAAIHQHRIAAATVVDTRGGRLAVSGRIISAGHCRLSQFQSRLMHQPMNRL